MTRTFNDSESNSLIQQREMLRQRLQAQREQLAEQLQPSKEIADSYPRSMTMRFLTQQPELATRLLTGLATLFLGARLLKSMTATLALMRVLRSVSGTAQKRLPAPDIGSLK